MGMEIKADEVEEVKIIGHLNGSDVKMLKTFGGFYVGIGKKNKNSKNPEALAAGSHPALINFQLEREFKNNFEPILCKNEHERLPKIENKNNNLSKSSLDKGLELFILSKDNEIDFIVNKFGFKVGEYKTEIKDNSLVLKKSEFNKEIFKVNSELAKSLAISMIDKANELKLDEIIKNSDPSQYETPKEFGPEELQAAVRQDISAEYDAINLYEAHKKASNNKELNTVIEHIVEEEKEHVAELQKMLNKLDTEQKEKSKKEGL
ncbi:MAG: ferritin-like domain-containing protein [Candidatus Nanoarchaeia archaeon]|nr:ferritin-like domain-containing protein [Candidatus Nanoarchaeia archaeon]